MAMIKWSRFSGEHDGELLILPVSPGERVKTASPVLPAVRDFVEGLETSDEYTYVLVNAMGYSEFFGPNSNKDYYGYNPHLNFNGLLHDWNGIGENPTLDRIRGKAWPHGYPCFYNAAVYAHHRNTSPTQLGFGDVVLAVPNPRMKRIELVLRISNAEAEKKGHTNILSRIRNGERTDVSMGAKVPFDECLVPETLVRTPTGHRQLGAIEVGDLILTHKGRYKQVTRVFSRESSGDVIDLVATGVPKMTMSCEHPMYIVRGASLRKCKGSANGKKRRCCPKDGVCTFCGKSVSLSPEWVRADAVSVGDYLAAPVDRAGDEVVSSDKARLLGYYLGDGWTIYQRSGKKKDGPPYLIAFGISAEHARPEHQQSILDSIEAVTDRNEPRVYSEGGGRAANKVYCYCRDTAAELLRLGGERSRGKRIHEEVFSWSGESILSLLGGWVDTDGHSDAEKNSVRISTASRGLALDCQRLCRAVGIPASIIRQNNSSGYLPGSVGYHVFIPASAVSSTELWNYSEKVVQWDQVKSGGSGIVIDGGYALHPIRSISENDETVTFCNLSVERDESFVAEGVATHNCSVCTDWSRVREAFNAFDPKAHAHHGIPILREHQKSPIRGIARTRKEYCFPAGTPIQLASGAHIPIEDIRVGDKVLSHDGSARRVVSLMPNHDRKSAVVVSPYGFPEQVVTSEHPYLAYRRRNNDKLANRNEQMDNATPVWVPAEKLARSDVLVHPVLPMGKGDTSTSVGYLLGRYIATGYVANPQVPGERGSVSITMLKSEKSRVEELISAAHELDPTVTTTLFDYEHCDICDLRITGDKVVSWLASQSSGELSKRRLHPDVFKQNEEFGHALIRGWVDGAGEGRDPDSVLVATASDEMAIQLQDLAARLGIIFEVAKLSVAAAVGSRHIWHISLTGDAVHAAKSGRPQELFDRNSKTFFWKGYLCTLVKSVRNTAPLEQTYNFEVDKTHSYIAAGLAVHNCDHMKTQAGQVLPDGKKVFVYNTFPRFFDISFVWVGADKTARVMWYLRGDSPIQAAPPAPATGKSSVLEAVLSKVAQVDLRKMGEMEKDIPSGLVQSVLSAADNEPTIPPKTLDVLKERCGGTRPLLSTLASAGIVLKPEEFQRVVGPEDHKDSVVLRALSSMGRTFDTSHSGVDDHLAVSPNEVVPDVIRSLGDLMRERSVYTPYLAPRVRRITIVSRLIPRTVPVVDTGEASTKLAALYNGYRLSAIENAHKLADKSLASVVGDLGEGAKFAAISGKAALGLLLGTGSLVSLTSAHLRGKERRGHRLGVVSKFVADHPTMTSAVTAGAGIRAVMGVQAAGGVAGAAEALADAATAIGSSL